MVKPNAKVPWDHFSFLHVSIPTLTDASSTNPLEFVLRAQQIINGHKSSLAVYLTGQLLEIVKKFRGPEAVTKYIHATLEFECGNHKLPWGQGRKRRWLIIQLEVCTSRWLVHLRYFKNKISFTFMLCLKSQGLM
ncbi:hypothetical protein Patl1_02276 [Pistacia atlantica]|uniref:Uncharacterized protein n=1 Tax=Pistacia atlantica TaxID=434234 RepID=A0ACC1C7K4_9ROSI|nr:hypothetical protein Patl1_02276 [Pistacia atlantica]